jgi:hypothetical protein
MEGSLRKKYVKPTVTSDKRRYINVLRMARRVMEPLAMEPEGCEYIAEGSNIVAMSEFLELFRGSRPSKP